jgi:hypothetical protein
VAIIYLLAAAGYKIVRYLRESVGDVNALTSQLLCLGEKQDSESLEGNP